MKQIKPHILQLTPHFYWPHLSEKGWPVKFDAMGGMQNQLFRQINFLSHLGIQQTVITLKIPGAPQKRQINESTMVFGARVPIFPVRSRIRGMKDLNISWSLGVFKTLFRLKNDFTAIHTHCSGVFLPLITGVFVSKFLSKPLILTIHCSTLATYKPLNLLDRLMLPLTRAIERYALKKAHHCIFLTQRTKEISSNVIKGLEEKSSIVSDSIDSQYFCKLADDSSVQKFCEKYAIPSNIPIVAYIGRIAREKGWKHIVELARLSRELDLHFLIVGNGNEFDKMTRLVNKLGLNFKFTFTGYISQENVPTALKLSNVLILPSQHEEFGSVLLEAMAMGIPPVAFAVGGVIHVLQNEKTGLLIPEGDVQAMLSAILRLVRNPNLAQSISQNGKDHVAQNYELENICLHLKKIYKEVTL